MYLSPRKKLFVDTATEMFGEGAVITKAEKTAAAEKAGVPFRHGLRVMILALVTMRINYLVRVAMLLLLSLLLLLVQRRQW